MSRTYDGHGHVTSETVAPGTTQAATTSYTWQGNLLAQITDPNQNATSFGHDAAGHVTSMTDANHHTATATYDAQGERTSSTNRNGERRDYTYNAAGQETGETWYAADGVTVTEQKSYTYDAQGRVATAGNDAGTYTYHYDAQGRLGSVEEPAGVTLTFGYDAAGHRVSVADSQGGGTTSTYTAAGKLASRTLTQDGQAVLTIEEGYDALSRLASQTRRDGKGVVVETSQYRYDASGNLAQITHRAADGTLLDNFQYGSTTAGAAGLPGTTAGRVTTAVEDGVTHTYTYDAAGQLTGADGQTWTYDANGNRTGGGHVVGTNNELSSDGTWNYTYDADGNVTGKVNIASGQTWSYGYDAADELVSVTRREAAGGPIDLAVTYQYDVYGNRVAQSVDLDGDGPQSATVTKFVLDGWKQAVSGALVGNEAWDVWADLGGDGSVEARYVQGDAIDQVFARVGADGQTGWYLTDRLGSVRTVLDGVGSVVDRVAYDVWGNVTSETNATARGRYGWTGREKDVETGLQYNRARYYDSTTGRWMSQDPLGFDAGDSNLYRYVRNQPTGATDPSGLEGPEGIFLVGRKYMETVDRYGKQYADNLFRGQGFDPVALEKDYQQTLQTMQNFSQRSKDLEPLPPVNLDNSIAHEEMQLTATDAYKQQQEVNGQIDRKVVNLLALVPGPVGRVGALLSKAYINPSVV